MSAAEGPSRGAVGSDGSGDERINQLEKCRTSTGFTQGLPPPPSRLIVVVCYVQETRRSGKSEVSVVTTATSTLYHRLQVCSCIFLLIDLI